MPPNIVLGLNDSEGRDTEHIQNIVENLRDYKYVNMFLIVRNGHEIRMTNTYSDMLRTFEMIFGVCFFKLLKQNYHYYL